MIAFSFSLHNPWSNKFENLWNRTWSTPFKHKFLELEVLKDNGIVSFSVRSSIRQSHGGFSMDLGLLGYSFSFNFYDNRHWSYEFDRYFKYDEENGMH